MRCAALFACLTIAFIVPAAAQDAWSSRPIKTRAPQLPDVPTTLEAGFLNSDYTLWIGILGPVGTPKAVTEKLNAEMKKAFEAPALKEKLDKIGVQPKTMSPEEFATLVKDEIKTYGDFVQKSGITMN